MFFVTWLSLEWLFLCLMILSVSYFIGTILRGMHLYIPHFFNLAISRSPEWFNYDCDCAARWKNSTADGAVPTTKHFEHMFCKLGSKYLVTIKRLKIASCVAKLNNFPYPLPVADHFGSLQRKYPIDSAPRKVSSRSQFLRIWFATRLTRPKFLIPGLPHTSLSITSTSPLSRFHSCFSSCFDHQQDSSSSF